MKIAIFGATGLTGRHLVEKSLAAGHEVLALARTPAKLDIKHERLTIVLGDVEDVAAVEKMVKDVDAVVSVLGPNSKGSTEYVITRGITHILDAMKRHQVSRLVIAAGAGIRDPKDKPGLIHSFFGFMIKLLSPTAVADMTRVVELVRASDRDWVVVRAPMLTNDPEQGDVKVGYIQDVGVRLSRADLAAFMLKHAQQDTYLRQSPVISG